MSPISPPTAPVSEALKGAFIAASSAETYADGWASLQQLSPDFLHAATQLHLVPKQKLHLSSKMQSLVALCVSSAATHLYRPGIAAHAAAALEAGATPAELVEVIELTCTLGIHACNIGVPLLVQVMREEGMYEGSVASRELDPRREELKAAFTRNRGYWHEFWEDFLKLDPEFFEAYLALSSVPWVKDVKGAGKGGGALPPKDKELIYCAFDAAATHLYQPGLKLHMKNALRLGAKPEEIMEVLEIATALSLHTASVAAPILVQEIERSALGVSGQTEMETDEELGVSGQTAI